MAIEPFCGDSFFHKKNVKNLRFFSKYFSKTLFRMVIKTLNSMLYIRCKEIIVDDEL